MNLRFVLPSALFAATARAGVPSAADLEHFEKQVRPVLVEHCFECHGEKKQTSSMSRSIPSGAPSWA